MAKTTKAERATKAKTGKGAGPGAPEAPSRARRKGPGLLDRLTGLVVVLFLVTAAVQHVVAA